MRTHERLLFFVVLSAVLTVLVPRAAAAQEVVRISGSTTLYVTFFEGREDAIGAAAGVKLELLPSTSKPAMLDLLAGRTQVAMISAPLPDIWSKLSPDEQGSHSLAEFKVYSLGDSRVEFIVHPSNPLKSLTFAQLAKLFEGKVTNWKDLGGADLPVTVVSNPSAGAVRIMVEEKLLGGRSITEKAVIANSSPKIIQIVKQVPGAIAHASSKFPLDGTTVLKTNQVINQQFFLVTASKPTEGVAKVVANVVKAARK